MVHGVWMHYGKNLKKAAHHSIRTAARSQIDELDMMKPDHVNFHTDRAVMKHQDKRAANRRKVSELKQQRNEQRDTKKY